MKKYSTEKTSRFLLYKQCFQKQLTLLHPRTALCLSNQCTKCDKLRNIRQTMNAIRKRSEKPKIGKGPFSEAKEDAWKLRRAKDVYEAFLEKHKAET
jgi:hypothetical protein